MCCRFIANSKLFLFRDILWRKSGSPIECPIKELIVAEETGGPEQWQVLRDRSPWNMFPLEIPSLCSKEEPVLRSVKSESLVGSLDASWMW